MKVKYILLAAFTLVITLGGVRMDASIGVTPQSSDRVAVLSTRNPNGIEIRRAATLNSPAPYIGENGDSVTILKELRTNGQTWNYIRIHRTGREGWVLSEDLRSNSANSPRLADANPRQPAPSYPSTNQNTPIEIPPVRVDTNPQTNGGVQWVNPQPTPSTSTNAPVIINVPPAETATAPRSGDSVQIKPVGGSRPPQINTAQTPKVSPSERTAYSTSGGYTSEQINYFLEIALGNEFGGKDARIRKWQGTIRIKINGSPTAEDLRTLNTVISELNGLTSPAAQLQIDDRNPNLQVYFVPESQFRKYEPNYRITGARGFTWVNWYQNVIQQGKVLIDTSKITQAARNHVIREEITQSLGLLRDSYTYKDSVFFQGWNGSTQYTEMDKAIIQMLYRSEIAPGATKTEVANTLRRLP